MTSQYACPMMALTLCPAGQAHTYVNGCQTGPCAPIDPNVTIHDPNICQSVPQKQFTTAQVNASINYLIQNWSDDPGLPSCLNFLLHYETSDGGTPTLPSGYTIPEHPMVTGMMIAGVIVVLILVGMLK